MKDSPYLLLGESPNVATRNRPRLWLLPDSSGIPHSANRLLEATGWTKETYLRIFRRDNLVHTLPRTWGPARSGRRFPMATARRRVPKIFDLGPELDGMVVLGGRVKAAFDWFDDDGGKLRQPDVPLLTWLEVRDRRKNGAAKPPIRAAVVPHPSGLNRWWNDEENCLAARRFFQDLELSCSFRA